jgi:activating signal cointegrator 1
MKAISLHQPWADMVKLGHKTYETRGWSTKHRGPIAIHASRSMAHLDLMTEPPFSTCYDKHLIKITELGSIVAVAEVSYTCPAYQITADLCESAEELQDMLKHPECPKNLRPEWENQLVKIQHELAFGDYTMGRFAWKLTNIKRLPNPIPCRGYQKIWNLDENITAQIEAQLKQLPS